MIHLQNIVSVPIIKATSTATNATTTGTVDTLGFDQVGIEFVHDTAAAASNNPVSMWVCECDTSNGTFVAITGAAGDATDGFTIGNVSTTLQTIHRVNIGMKGRKRYLQAGVTAGTAAAVIAINALLSKAEDSTVAAAKMATFANVAG